jgi:polyisoprenoid-binding protein YceI
VIYSTSTKITVAVLVMMFAAPVYAAKWRSIAANSSLEFIVTFEGEESAGKFAAFDTVYEFEQGDATPSSLHVTVDVRSATLSSADLDEAMAEKTWFDSATYPVASFTANVAQLADGQEFLARGMVSIKGVERELDLPLHVSIEGNRMQMSGNVSLSRLDFGIGTGEWLSDSSIGHAVIVKFEVLLQKTD